jgi:hypothetical protein
MVVYNHEYYQTNRVGPEAVSGPRGAGSDSEPVSDVNVVSDGIRQLF